MLSSTLSAFLVASFALTASAFDAVAAPSTVAAGSDFTITITPGSDEATAFPPGYSGGPSCYLENSTSTTNTTLSLSIPADIGPNSDWFSIATQEFPPADSNKYTFSNHFNLTGSSLSSWSDYENHLNGSLIWTPSALPCSSFNCARQCAMASYPDDLTKDSAAYGTMSDCILKCPGVTARAPETSSSSASTYASATGMATSTRSGASATSSSGNTDDDSTASSSIDAAPAATSTGAAVNLGVSGSSLLIAVGGIFALAL
ncbi:hypothetical protein H2203_008823 [Taxawa tesnikishii (nom. ined.)]|nr:hypothetical protein H2203_008823 [Dothideales sp. JES 119]